MLLSSRLYRKFGVLVVGTLVISALAAGPTLAARKGRGGQTTPTATLTVIPNPVPVNSSFTLTGSGFLPSAFVQLVWSRPTCCFSEGWGTDSSGNLWPHPYTTGNAAMTYGVDAYQWVNGKFTLMGTVTFDVVP